MEWCGLLMQCQKPRKTLLALGVVMLMIEEILPAAQDRITKKNRHLKDAGSFFVSRYEIDGRRRDRNSWPLCFE